jgi:hypothetical protein
MSTILYNVGGFIASFVVTLIVISFIVPLFFPQVSRYLRDKTLNSNTKSYTKDRKIVPIITGECAFGTRKGFNLGTVYKTMSNFVDISPSVDQKGGVEFSYTFWINMRSKLVGSSYTYPLRTDGTVVFCKGIYPTDNPTDVSNLSARVENATIPDKATANVLVKCPMVRFTPPAPVGVAVPLNHVPSLQVEFNTFKNPHNVIILEDTLVSQITGSEENPKWHLISVVFKDHISHQKGYSEPTGLQVDVFFNDVLAKSHVVPNDGVKLNDGNLYVNPSRTSDTDSTYSTLTYYNYALTASEITNIFQKGDFKGQCTVHYGYGADADVLDIGATKRATRPVSLYRQLVDVRI